MDIAPDNDTVVSRLCNLLNDPPLAHKKLSAQTMVKAHMGKAVLIGKLDIVPAMMTQHFTDVIGVHALVLCEGLDDFLIVIVPAQKVGETFAQFPATAAELPADGDDMHRIACFHSLEIILRSFSKDWYNISPTNGFVNRF